MKYAVISDIHGNLGALEKFQAAISALKGSFKVLCLGDLPDGQHPAVTEEILRVLAEECRAELVAGNTDKDLDLPRGPRLVDGKLAMCHGSPFSTSQYLLETPDIRSAFDWMAQNRVWILFNGHTHIPAMHACAPGNRVVTTVKNLFHAPLGLEPDYRYILNPGTLGKPKTVPHVKSFLVLDTVELTATWHRI